MNYKIQRLSSSLPKHIKNAHPAAPRCCAFDQSRRQRGSTSEGHTHQAGSEMHHWPSAAAWHSPMQSTWQAKGCWTAPRPSTDASMEPGQLQRWVSGPRWGLPHDPAASHAAASPAGLSNGCTEAVCCAVTSPRLQSPTEPTECMPQLCRLLFGFGSMLQPMVYAM